MDRPEYRSSVEESGGQIVVAVGGEIDLATCDAFATTVREALARGPVVVDLAGIEFMDSSGVRTIDALLREPGTLVFRDSLQPPVRRLLELVGMLDLIPMEPA